jgi:MotA/TolQ/ExbB proton channel family
VATRSHRAGGRTAPGPWHEHPCNDWRGGAIRRFVRHRVGHHEQLCRHLARPHRQPGCPRPGIAEALLATAFGLAAAMPAVVIYNAFTRSIGGYRALLADASIAALRLVSRDLDQQAIVMPNAPRAAVRALPWIATDACYRGTSKGAQGQPRSTMRFSR